MSAHPDLLHTDWDAFADCKDIGVQVSELATIVAQVGARLADRAGVDAYTPRLPDTERVAEAAAIARRLLFPEFWTGEAPRLSWFGTSLHRLYDLLVDVLAAEFVANPMRKAYGVQDAPPAPRTEKVARCRAHETALSLLDDLPNLRAVAETDLQAALDGDPAARSRAEVVLCYPGFHAVVTHRVAHQLWLAGAHLVARLMTELAHHRTGIDLHPGATIGPAFFIDHGTGVVVGETAILGARVRLYQGVTVGARSVPKVADGEQPVEPPLKRHPTLEDDVVVYANATILGGDVTIGRGAMVGGNTWITTSIPPGARLRVDVAARVADAVVMVPDGQQPT
jgi:serine O-acetyltransferase